MAQFNFSLQKVLEYREQLENQAKLAFAVAHKNLTHTENKLAQLKTMLEEQLKASADPSKTSEERWLIEQYLKGLRTDINLSTKLLIELEIVYKRTKEVLVAKAKDRKVLEKLKEKQYLKFAQDELTQEQKEYDEISTIRFKVANL